VQTAGLLAPSWRAKKISPALDRVRPVAVDNSFVLSRRVDLSWPAGWRLQTRLERCSLKNAFGSATTDVEQRPGGLTVRQSLTLRRTYQPPPSINDLAQLMGRGGELHIPTLVFGRVPDKPPPAESP
jgi:hypothetical protein